MERHPKSNTLLQLFIQNATDAIDLRVRLEPFIQHALRKGIPSLFNSIRYLYTDSWKINVVEEILNDYMISLTKYASFDDQSSKEDPTVLLWTLYSLSQHYSAVHDPSQAIKVIDLAIKHTPTLVELYMQKARILKVLEF